MMPLPTGFTARHVPLLRAWRVREWICRHGARLNAAEVASISPTIQQYREVPVSSHGDLPVIARLPGGTDLALSRSAFCAVTTKWFTPP